MKRIISFALSFMLVFTMMPCMCAGTEESYAAEDNFGVPGEDYVAGEVLVCVKGGAEALAESEAFEDGGDDQTVQAAGLEDTKGSFDGCRLTIEDTLINIEKEEAKELSQQSDLLSAQAVKPAKVQPYSIVLVKSSRDNVSSLVQSLEQLECVEFAEPNMICELTGYKGSDAEDEPFFKYQWYSDKKATGASCDINAGHAYENPKFESSEEVVVAVMDSGVDYTHPDLKNVMWDEGESIPALTALGGGKYGINTAGDAPADDPMDNLVGHGTHCASTIASQWANKEGIAGINGNARIMACRWMTEGGNTADYIRAMNYVITAKEEGVNIVATNNSWGATISTGFISSAAEMVIDEAGLKGIVSCFSAGNSAYDHDRYENMNYYSPYVLSVGAMDSNGRPAYFSERGRRTVDVFAPGTQILAATSLQDKVYTMPPQYLPWLGGQGSFIYEDFESGDSSITFEAYKYDPETQAKGDSLGTDETKSPGYGDEHARKIIIEDAGTGDQIALQINVPVSMFEEMPDREEYYMSFQAGAEGFDFESDGAAHISYPEYLGDEWTQLYDGRWRCMDENWSISNVTIDRETMEDMVAKAEEREDKTVQIRFPMTVKEITGTDPEIHIDLLGFGTEKSKYFYSDGTSMACPCAAAVTSIVAGSMENMPSSGEEALEVIAKVKGGAAKSDKLENACTTGGYVQADSAFRSESEYSPVPDKVELSEDGSSAVIKGHFFGKEKGSVTVEGSAATIQSWDENEITIAIPKTAEYKMSEYRILTKDERSGRDFAVFRDSQQSQTDPVFEEIATGDFAYKKGDREIRTEKLLPMRIAANDDGLMAILSDSDSTILALEFYSFAEKKWSQIECPEGIKADEVAFECCYSIVGAADEFYMLMKDKEQEHLLTYSTSENKWLYDKKLPKPFYEITASFGGGQVLGLIDGDDGATLCVSFGECNEKDTGIYEIFPDTGHVGEKLSDTEGIFAGNNWGGVHLVSGDTQIIAGINEGEIGRILEQLLGKRGAPCDNPAVLKDGKWEKSAVNFFDASAEKGTSDGRGGKGLDSDQVFVGAYGAIDGGFIMAGPARDINGENMTDTWIYDMESDSYEGLPCRVNPVKVLSPAGVTHDGKFYVMGADGSRGGKLFLKSLDLKALGRTSTDCAHAAKRESGNKYITAIGENWLDGEKGGYYVKGEDGVLTHEGASPDNYCVRYEPDLNRVTLNSFEYEGLQMGRRTECPAALVSNKDLTIELKGSSVLRTSEKDRADIWRASGVYCTGNMTFTGNGNAEIYSGDDTITDFGVYASGNIRFSGTGSITITAEKPDETKLMIYVEQPIQTTGIFAESVITGCGASLKAVSGDAEGEGDTSSIAILTEEAPVIGPGTVTTVSGKAAGNSGGYSIAPALAPNTKASVRYGESEEAAYKDSEKAFGELESNIGMAFTQVKASAEAQPAETQPAETQPAEMTIVLKGSKIKKVRKLRRGFKVTWKKQSAKAAGSHVTGYQIQYSTKKAFTGKTTKIKTVKGWKKTKKKIRKLKKRKKYYVRVRTYMKHDGRTYYSKWSGKKAVRTR